MTGRWQAILMATLGVVAVMQWIRAYQLRRASAKREELFRIVTENAADMIALVDVKGNRLYNSPAYRRVLGYSAADLAETSPFDQIHPDDRFKVLEAAREARQTGVGRKLEYRIRHKNGTWRVLESVAGTIRDGNGDVGKLVIVNRDITDRKQAEELAERNAFHDGLTDLPNRRLFLDRLHNLYERSKRNPARQHALMLVDLDGFKNWNDALGPSLADQVIVEIGGRIEGCLRGEDTVSRAQNLALQDAILSRMGGDEFTVLVEGIAEPSDAMRVAKRILAALARPMELAGREVRITASIGIGLSAPTHTQAEDLLQEADVAMRRAKSLGGSRCEVFDEALHNRAMKRLNLEGELREAIRQNQFRVYYQPIVELNGRRLAGFEALLRWQHPEQGLISPQSFLAAAEDTGLLVSTGQWILLEACKQLRAWDAIEHGAGAVHVCVNLSPKQFCDPGLAGDLEAILRDTGVDGSRLRVELTERVAAADPKLSHTVLSQLRQLGVKVTLDDFGTGRLSLSELGRLPADALKIDGELIETILTDRNAYETVELILLLGQKFKLQMIAEGIESEKEWEMLRALGCEMGQGYFFSPPVEAGAAGKLLMEWRQGGLAKSAEG
jgi:diguanylate cyclase (GGDEF)-like protein/PAS domain S-box-containing protein